MKSRSRMIVGALVVVVIALVIATWIGSRRQLAALTAEVDRLMLPGGAQVAPTHYREFGLENVPAPVARYMRLALPTPPTSSRSACSKSARFALMQAANAGCRSKLRTFS